jgi:hypothetical protein
MRGVNFKYLAFYTGSVSAVIVLFVAITAYGEAHLQAPVNLKGQYRVVVKAPSACSSGDAQTATNPALLLILQQSGIYLYANLRQETAAMDAAYPSNQNGETTQSKPLLEGRLKDNHQIYLSGNIPDLFPCAKQTSKQSSPVKQPVELDGVITAEKGFQGKIWLSLQPSQYLSFTATRLEPQPAAQPSTQSH